MKAYILRTDNKISMEYAKTCAESCDEVGLKWEYFQGWRDMPSVKAYQNTGVPMKKLGPPKAHNNPAGCAGAGHLAIWKKITEGEDEIAIILEHDAIMFHKPNIQIPDNTIVVLGYRMFKPNQYNHEKAGPPKSVKPINSHIGAHAYMITKSTAQSLVDEVIDNGRPLGNIDQHYFIGPRKTKANLAINDPISAVAWVRDSTIWGRYGKAHNKNEIQSFTNNLR